MAEEEEQGHTGGETLLRWRETNPGYSRGMVDVDVASSRGRSVGDSGGGSSGRGSARVSVRPLHASAAEWDSDSDDDAFADDHEVASRPLLTNEPASQSQRGKRYTPPSSPLTPGSPSSTPTPFSSRAWTFLRKWKVEVLIWSLLIFAVCIVVVSVSIKANNPVTAQERACSVYCHGPLVAAVARLSPYEDSKTFVDMPMKENPEDILSAFKGIEKGLTKQGLLAFLQEHFADPEDDQARWTPPDFPPSVTFDKDIANQTLRQWVQDVHDIWPKLGRSTNTSVREYPERHSLLQLPHPYVVPGGRFREMYYWDMFWVVRGLIRSGMLQTAHNLARNYYSLIARFGFVPNGARVYYLTRSQPPVLHEMVMALYEATGNATLLTEAYPFLLREYEYWNSTSTNKRVTVGLGPTSAWLTRYYADTISPRPESFREDQHTADVAGFDEEQRQQFYRNVASGAETGWDFSSRWLKRTDDLSTIRTTDIVPVDLNCFMLRFERHLSTIAKHAGDHGSVRRWSHAADLRARAMLDLMYNETTGHFHDLELPTANQIAHPVTPAAFMPLWADVSPSQELKERLVESFTASRLLKAAAVDTTLTRTGQQWDSPNAWAPLQWITVRGLERVGADEATALANSIKCRWLGTAMQAYHSTGHMYEKYDASVMGKGGGGGEYKPQLGFGWTNGVVLDFAADLASTYDDVCLGSRAE